MSVDPYDCIPPEMSRERRRPNPTESLFLQVSPPLPSPLSLPSRFSRSLDLSFPSLTPLSLYLPTYPFLFFSIFRPTSCREMSVSSAPPSHSSLLPFFLTPFPSLSPISSLSVYTSFFTSGSLSLSPPLSTSLSRYPSPSKESPLVSREG